MALYLFSAVKRLIVIGGPTASGKTELAIRLAKHFQTEIISADSRQVFREMNIGTAKPDVDQLAEVPHHFVNIFSIAEEYNAGKFELDAINELTDLFKHKESVILAGGSGMYINAVLFGFDELPETDPVLRATIRKLFQQKGIIHLQQEILRLDPQFATIVDMNNPQRLMRAIEACYLSGQPYSSLLSQTKKERNFEFTIYVLDVPREQLYQRINERVDKMVASGLFEEVSSLYPFRENHALQTVGYKEIFEAMESGESKEITIERIKKNTRNYAKRQMTWFRRLDNAVFVPVEKSYEFILMNEFNQQ